MQACSRQPSPQAGWRGQGTAAHLLPTREKNVRVLLLVFSTPPGWCLWLYVEKYAARTRWAHVKSNKIIDLRWGWMVLKVRVRRRGELMTEKSTQRIGSN